MQKLRMNNQKPIIEGDVTYSRLFDALKGRYEVDNDDSVWEIFNQADDQIEEVVSALKLLSAPPAPFVVKLPRRLSPEGYNIDEAYMAVDANGDYLDRNDVIEAIKAAGGEVEK